MGNINTIADFMRHWNRMCRECFMDKDIDAKDVCANCPIRKEGLDSCCIAIFEISDIDDAFDFEKYNRIVEIVDKWAEIHPEPVYPSWLEYLVSIGVIHEGDSGDQGAYCYGIVNDIRQQLPICIAKKLGVSPKSEGTTTDN